MYTFVFKMPALCFTINDMKPPVSKKKEILGNRLQGYFNVRYCKRSEIFSGFLSTFTQRNVIGPSICFTFSEINLTYHSVPETRK